MAIQDTPVKEPNREMQDTPVRSNPRASHKSEDREAFETGQAALLDNYVTGNDVLQNYRRYSSVIDKSKELQRLAMDKAQKDAGDVAEEFVLDPYGAAGSIEETAQAVQRAREMVYEQSTDPDRQFTETLVGDRADFEEIERESANAKMHKLLADWQEETGTGEIIMDVAKGFIPFLESYKGYQLTGQYFGQDDEIKSAISAFKMMPPDEQLKVFPQLKAELQEKVGPLAGMEILGNFLTPMGQEDSQPFGDINRVFDAIDATGVGALAGLAFKQIKGGYNMAKSAKSLGNDDMAAEVSTTALADEQIAKTAGMDSTTATGNALPFDTSIEDIGHAGGLSTKILNPLEEFFGDVDKTAQDIIEGNGFLKEGIVNTKRRAELEAEAIDKLKREQAENIRITSKDENETRFEYQIVDEDGNITEQTYNMSLTLNDAGNWDQSTLSLVGEYLGSPTAFAKGTLRQDVDTAQNIDYLNARINRQLFDLTRRALEPVGLLPTPKTRASLAKVDKALLEGDEWKNVDGSRGTVFTPDELREKFSLEDNEISAYYRINRLYNNLFNIRNHEKRQEMVALGYKDVTIPGGGESLAGKVFEQANDAALSVRGRSINYVYDVDSDELINVREGAEGFFKQAYEDGKRVVRTEEPYEVGGDRGRVYYVLSDADNIDELPVTVLNRKAGYVPRVYEDNAYFVKEVIEESVDGDKTFNRKKTLRFFNNKREADEYRDMLRKQAKAQGLTDEQANSRFLTLADREEEILSAATGDIGHGSGGLYTGARAQDDILFGLNGDKPNRLNSFESLTRNIGNLSKFASINQWRLGLEQRWINTANNIFKAKGLERRVEGFERLPSISEASDEVRFLNRMHDQIRDWQNFPTTEERAWNSAIQKVYDWASDRGYNRTGKLVGNLKGTDPIATARATAFHSLLGWYNPSQLWVQMQGMAVAASLGMGKSLTKNLEQSIALHMMDTGRKTGNDIAGLVGKAAGMSSDEMKQLHKLWEKTGYRDSVLQTADHAAASKGYGMTMDLFKRAADTGLIFYRNGELINRRMSFTTAVSRWQERTGKAISEIDDDSLKGIMTDANNMMLNMTRANRAAWQKGVLSLPTQFLQVTTKFLETAGGFNRNFTGAERGKLIASQFLMYGTAGVPLANLGTKFLMEAMGVTQKEIEENPGLVKSWNDGLWGATTYWMMGADMEVASRGSLLRGVGDFVDNWFVQESTVATKLLGAFGSTGQRFWDSLTYNLKPYTLGGIGNTDWEDAASLATSPFLDTVSTFRNIEKAYIMNKLDAVYSKNGRPIDNHDYNFMEELMMGAGFQPTRTTEAWDLVQWEEAGRNVERKTTDYIMRRMNEFAAKHPDGNYTEEEFLEYEKDIALAKAHLDPDQALAVSQSIQQAYQNGSRRADAIQRVIRTIKENSVSDMINMKNTLTGQGILRLGLDTEEEE